MCIRDRHDAVDVCRPDAPEGKKILAGQEVGVEKLDGHDQTQRGEQREPDDRTEEPELYCAVTALIVCHPGLYLSLAGRFEAQWLFNHNILSCQMNNYPREPCH